jgi:hypothetical protein
MAENVFPIVDVSLSLDNYQAKCSYVRHKVLCSLSFSSSILSHISMLAGSRVVDWQILYPFIY